MRLTIRHPEWNTEYTLDSTHRTFELTPPEGIDINDVEVVADFIGVTGRPDPGYATEIVKEKYVKPAEQPGKPDEPDANESAVVEHSDNADAGVASVEDGGHGDSVSVGEAGDEQVANETVHEVVLEQATEVVVHRGPVEHHKPRRPKHA